jgi:hypothetical protein
VVQPKSGLGRQGLAEAPSGDSDTDPSGSASGDRICRNLAHLGLRTDKDLPRQHRSPRRAGGICRVPASGFILPAALLRAGRLRGPNRLGNLATPESPGRDSA